MAPSLLAPLLAAVAALALLTVLPGPDVAVVTRVALASGRAAAGRAALGIVSGLLAWGLLTAAGLAALLAASATAYTLVRLAGAAYLVWLGVQALRQGGRGSAGGGAPAGAEGAPPSRAFRTGLVTNLLNPKIAVFYTGLLPQLVPAGAPPAAALLGLVLVHAALSLAWLSGYAALVARASSSLQRPRVRAALDRVTGVALVGLGLRVAASARP